MGRQGESGNLGWPQRGEASREVDMVGWWEKVGEVEGKKGGPW